MSPPRRTRASPLRRSLWSAGPVLLFWSAPAIATYSIVGLDRASGQIGAAAVSCVGEDFDLREIMVLDPEVGAVMAQSTFSLNGRDEIFRNLKRGVSPLQAIEAVLTPEFDPTGDGEGASYRQYAALDLQGNVAAFTGDNCLPVAGDSSGTEGAFVFSVQGNVLSGPEVLEQLSAGFRTVDSDLARRLASAIEAVHLGGGGDARCAPTGGDAAAFGLVAPTSDPIELSAVSLGGDAAIDLVLQIRSSPLLQTEPRAPQQGGSWSSSDEQQPSESPRSTGCSWSPGPLINRESPLKWRFLGALSFAGFLFWRRTQGSRRYPG